MERNQSLRFSIVIPAYNEAGYIASTIKSIQNQDFRGNYEIIVVDNNCSDGTASIAKKLGAKVVEEKQAGVCFARQKGSEIATGQIVISSDADTIYPKDWLTKIDRQFKADATIVAVAGPCQYTRGPLWGEVFSKNLFKLIDVSFKLTGNVFYATATNIAFKKTEWADYNTSLTQGGDELDLIRNLKKRGKVVFLGDNVVFTSSRRLVHGFWYNVFMSFLTYYLLAYYLNRLFGHRIMGSAPAFRDEFKPRLFTLTQVCVASLVLPAFIIYALVGSLSLQHSLAIMLNLPLGN